MRARKVSQDYPAPASLESMGYTLDGYWTDAQSGSQTYHVPRLVISLRPVPRSDATAAAPIHFTDVESSSAELSCTILNEVRVAADGSAYQAPRLRTIVQFRARESSQHLEGARR